MVKILKTFLWSVPFLLSTLGWQNMLTNARVIIATIHLYEGGTKVEMKNAYGQIKSYEIKRLRKPN
jgi:hypothetical protein